MNITKVNIQAAARAAARNLEVLRQIQADTIDTPVIPPARLRPEFRAGFDPLTK